MERTRRAPAPPRTPPAGIGEDAAVLALEAFDGGAALVDLTHRRLAWCSPGFAARCCAGGDEAVESLEACLPGLAQALRRLAQAPAMRLSSAAAERAPRTRWRASGGATVVEAALVRPGLAALRLCPGSEDEDHAEAARRHLEDREKLLFTSRSLAVGEMATTLAHELNQPIGTVTNVLRGIRARLERQAEAPLRQELQDGVQLALDQALFAARVIARIREYTQSRRPRREPLELGAVVREAVALLDWEIRRDDVELALALPAEPCRIEGDEVMLQQLFVNLLRNALEAMRDGAGTPRRLEVALARERERAVLTVRDSGCGLPRDAAAQLFVPFQSTKPNGMGIGLNICRSFVELHQGRLWFTPNEGEGERGCTFHVALPLAAARDEDPRRTP